MTSLSVIENKISSVKKYLRILERYKRYSQDEIVNDIDKKGAVERYLYLAVQASIDLAESVIAYKNLRRPSTMSDSFYILQEEGIISIELTEKMVKMTGFRNIIAHDYEKLNYAIVYDVLQNRLIDIEDFLNRISSKTIS
ncbi:MAG: DUF86 domain-containing protein [Nitrospirae bacterium]|nr:DUF86 domain-containing protein [Nitrospirota bacterium]